VKCVVFCDFDGTITLRDTTDAILQRYAARKWESVERDWLAGKFGSEECLRRQMNLVRAGKEEIVSLLDTIEIDPHFADFVKFCEWSKIPLHVVSDGFDFVIDHVLTRGGFGHLKHFANTLIFTGSGLDTAFSNSKPDCDTCATCKVGLLNRLRKAGEKVVVIGDGFSDHYIAQCADIVFAKHKLRSFCEKNIIPFHPFETFTDIIGKMKDIITSEEEVFESENRTACQERVCAGIGALKTR
jgi:2,3-diketo-5-methylthio-1-phosphopentane phosphatase